MCFLFMAITQLNVVKSLPYIVSNAMALLTCLPIAIGIMAFGKSFGGLFENKMLAMTGTISYEIYLVHAFTLAMIKQSIISVFIFAVVTYVLAYILHIGMRKEKNAPSLPAVYEKYKERGGRPVFHPADIKPFTTLLTDIYDLGLSSDYIRDMRINEKLGTLLTLLMEQSWHPESVTVSRKRMELAAVKEYLDEHYTERITLDDLAERFFINKFYLSKIFKETYGTTVNNYLISKRITRAKQLLRFTDMTVDEVGAAVGMGDANYFSRMFRKVEGISPREYRKQW